MTILKCIYHRSFVSPHNKNLMSPTYLAYTKFPSLPDGLPTKINETKRDHGAAEEHKKLLVVKFL